MQMSFMYCLKKVIKAQLNYQPKSVLKPWIGNVAKAAGLLKTFKTL